MLRITALLPLVLSHALCVTVAQAQLDVPKPVHVIGTLEPVATLEINADVSGKVVAFGKEVDGKQIDYRSHVKKDQILLKIDPKPYEAELRKEELQLTTLQARIKLRQAELADAQALISQVNRQLDQALRSGDAPATDVTKLRDAYESARTKQGICEASLAEAIAGAKQCVNNVETARSRVDSCSVRSPLEGVVLDIHTEVGATVSSGPDAQALVLIASDLKHLKLLAAVEPGEAAQIHVGAHATFTSDAFSNESFSATVKRVFATQMNGRAKVQHVVELTVDNSNDRLLPYLIADAKIDTAPGK